MEFLIKKYYGSNSNTQENQKTLEQATEILNFYCQLETPQVSKTQEMLVGKFVRENQLISSAACTSFKASMYVRESLTGQNVKILDKTKLVKDELTGDIRISELTPLMVACMMGNMQTAKILIENARKAFEHSPQDFRMFIDIKIERSKGGNNALLYACNDTQGNYLLVQYMIDEAGADPNIMNDTLRNALLLATKRNQLNVVDLLVKKNVDINVTDKNECNALHLSSSSGYIEMTETILLHRSKLLREAKDAIIFDIDGEDSLTLTPLMKASINGHLEIVKLLLKFGANPRKKNKRGESALALACMQENLQICERLIIAKADVNETDFRKRTPLLKSARHNSQSGILQLLLKAGARPDIADEEGNTPMHFAAIRGTLEVGSFLLKLGANPYARNKKGFVPYEMTSRDEVKQIFQVCPVCMKYAAICCNHCLVMRYCDVECQKKDWGAHKKICDNFKRRLPGGMGLI